MFDLTEDLICIHYIAFHANWTEFFTQVYYKLTEQMDTHDVYRNRSSDVLSELGESIPSLTIGISR